MRRKFDNRITQQKSHKISKTSKSIEAVDEGQEIELLVKRKARRDAAEATQEQTATDQKRRRVDSRMVDQMKGGANSSAVIEYPWGRSRSGEGISKEPFHNPHQMIDKASPDQGSANSRPQSPSKISVILSKFKSKNLTAQATYSTRSKSEKDPSTPQALPSVLDEPRPQRYSKTHDMGKQWTKPLTYPKIGKKKAFIEWKDLERLDEGEFFNDTLIEFYLRYLQHQLEIERPQLAKKIYFFNTFSSRT